MNSRSIEIWDQLANEMITRDLYEEALYYFNKMLEVEPLNSYAVEHKANMLDILGRYEEALECIDNYLESNSTDANIWILKGDLLDAHLNDYEGALKCFDRALEIDPENEEAWSKKGYILKEMRRYAEAAKCFRTTMRLMVDHPPINSAPIEYWDNFKGCYTEFAEEYDNCLKLMGD